MLTLSQRILSWWSYIQEKKNFCFVKFSVNSPLFGFSHFPVIFSNSVFHLINWNFKVLVYFGCGVFSSLSQLSYLSVSALFLQCFVSIYSLNLMSVYIIITPPLKSLYWLLLKHPIDLKISLLARVCSDSLTSSHLLVVTSVNCMIIRW